MSFHWHCELLYYDTKSVLVVMLLISSFHVCVYKMYIELLVNNLLLLLLLLLLPHKLLQLPKLYTPQQPLAEQGN